jgi:hypothetical protein
MTPSIYRRALGDQFERMHPQLQRFFGQPGGVHATGVFDEVGSRVRWLKPLWRMLASFGLLLPEYGRGVPFGVSIVPLSTGLVATTRTLLFPAGVRELSDETHLVAGRLIDVHAGGRVLVHMRAFVPPDGSLRLVAGATRLRVASVLIRMPTVPVTLSQRWDEAGQQFHITVQVRLPLLGEVFGYRGTFRLS